MDVVRDSSFPTDSDYGSYASDEELKREFAQYEKDKKKATAKNNKGSIGGKSKTNWLMIIGVIVIIIIVIIILIALFAYGNSNNYNSMKNPWQMAGYGGGQGFGPQYANPMMYQQRQLPPIRNLTINTAPPTTAPYRNVGSLGQTPYGTPRRCHSPSGFETDLIYFHNPNCAACKMFNKTWIPLRAHLQQEYPNLHIIEVGPDSGVDGAKLAQEFDIQNTPTLIIKENNLAKFDKIEGNQSFADAYNWITSNYGNFLDWYRTHASGVNSSNLD